MSFVVKWKPRDVVLTKEFTTEEEANNFKKNCRSLGIKVIGSENPEKQGDKIEWPRI
jgi:hypothetical protein